MQNFSCIDFESACLNLTEHDVAIRENVQNVAKFGFFCERQAGRKETRYRDGELAMATIREILQK